MLIPLPQTKSPKKSSAVSIPLRRVFTSCRVVASRRTRFVCLFICLFVPLVGCCVVALPLIVPSRPVSSPRHVVVLRLVFCCPSCCCRVVESSHRGVIASSHRCVLSHLVVVLHPLTHFDTPTLFDCCVYCRHRAAAATVDIAVPPAAAAVLLVGVVVVVVVVLVVFIIVIVILLS
jgi:hypothetical protein